MDRRWLPGATILDRRAMLSWCLGILGLSRRPIWGSTTTPNEYRRLTKPVVLPSQKVAASWQPVWFDALAPAPDPDAGSGPDVLVKGILLRLPEARGATRVRAFCLTCPHEICQVNYVEDTESVRLEPAAKPDHPLFVCPCHFSIFNPLSNGARIAGPASRGLYRFRLELGQDAVTITEVEEDALG